MACQTLAKVLRRSVGEFAPPLTTFQLRYPRMIHAESKTHRLLSENEIEIEPETPGLMNDPTLSRNARSSRAVPVNRMIEEVLEAPYIPRYWGKNQKGMQASEECNEQVELEVPEFLVDCVPNCRPYYEPATREQTWLWARDQAVRAAWSLHRAGYHKQVVNRLLEPFMHIDVVVTGTEWDNFFALRDHDAAEPHIRDLARAMKAAIEDWDRTYGGPDILRPGQWHLPYVSDRDQADTRRIWDAALAADADLTEMARAVSVTRCAQVSYTPFHEAKLSVEQEVARHDALISARPMHASPCEHQATPDTRLPDGSWANPHLHGNLRGWVQYRKTLIGECA